MPVTSRNRLIKTSGASNKSGVRPRLKKSEQRAYFSGCAEQIGGLRGQQRERRLNH
jgi:hypothetical protein